MIRDMNWWFHALLSKASRLSIFQPCKFLFIASSHIMFGWHQLILCYHTLKCCYALMPLEASVGYDQNHLSRCIGVTPTLSHILLFHTLHFLLWPRIYPNRCTFAMLICWICHHLIGQKNIISPNHPIELSLFLLWHLLSWRMVESWHHFNPSFNSMTNIFIDIAIPR